MNKKTSSVTSNKVLSDLPVDFKEMRDQMSDDVEIDLLATNFDIMELLMKVNTFANKLHFFDDVVDYVRPDLTKNKVISIETKVNVETQVINFFMYLFNVEYSSKSPYKQYSRCSLEVYNLI